MSELVEKALGAFAMASGLGIIPEADEDWDEDIKNGMRAAIAVVLEEAAFDRTLAPFVRLIDVMSAMVTQSGPITGEQQAEFASAFGAAFGMRGRISQAQYGPNGRPSSSTSGTTGC